MSTRNLALLARWARRGAWSGLVLALALPLAAFLADLGWGREVLLIAPYDPSVVALNRLLWSAGDPVPDVYGSPMSEPTRVLLFRGRDLIRPEEDPTLSLLPATVEGRRPIQARTVWWAVRLGEVGLGAATAGFLGLAFFARRRETPGARTAAA